MFICLKTVKAVKQYFIMAFLKLSIVIQNHHIVADLQYRTNSVTSLEHLLINTPVYRTFAVRDDLESSANVFARDLLAPACVLHELHATTAEEIAKICNISMQAAKNRAERMQVLEARNKYYLHPLERQVRQQFEQFIEEYRSKM